MATRGARGTPLNVRWDSGTRAYLVICTNNYPCPKPTHLVNIGNPPSLFENQTPGGYILFFQELAVTAEVVAFPKAAPAPSAENTEDDLYGPPAHSEAWICLPCDEDPEVHPDGKFCFYVTQEGVHCWTCRAVQYFPCE